MQKVLHEVRAQAAGLENAMDGRGADGASDELWTLVIQVSRCPSQGPRTAAGQGALAVESDQLQAHRFGEHRPAPGPFPVE